MLIERNFEFSFLIVQLNKKFTVMNVSSQSFVAKNIWDMDAMDAGII